MKAYEEQQKFIAETTDFIERFKGTYSKTNQVQSRVRMLEKLELVEVDEIDTSAIRLRFPPAPRSIIRLTSEKMRLSPKALPTPSICTG